jgi:hypothetical protein
VKKNEVIRTAAFLLLAAVMILCAALVFARKTACDYTTRVQGFYNEPEDSFDVLFYGSSHAYCTVSPLVLWDETGLKSYVLSTQQQPLTASYYYMKDSFQRQSPKLIVLEAYFAGKLTEDCDDGVLRDAIDPMPWSKNKIEMIKALVPEGSRSSYYFDFLKYHSRWSELSASDFDFSYLTGRDSYRGYIHLTPSRTSLAKQVDYSGVVATPLPEENVQLLLDIRALAEENSAQLALFIAPYQSAGDDLDMLKAIHDFADEYGVPLLDFNEIYDEVGFDGEQDFFDSGHLNVKGSAVATAYLGQWIQDIYDLPVTEDDTGAWQADYDRLYG